MLYDALFASSFVQPLKAEIATVAFEGMITERSAEQSPKAKDFIDATDAGRTMDSRDRHL